MNPWALLIALLLLIGSHFGAYRYGKHVAAGEQAQAALDGVKEAQDRAQAAGAVDAARQADLDANAAAGAQEDTAYALTDAGRADCLDDAGLGLFNSAGGHPAAVRAAPGAARTGAPAAAEREKPGRAGRVAPER